MPVEPTTNVQTSGDPGEAIAAGFGVELRSAAHESNATQGGHGNIGTIGNSGRILEKFAPADSVENEFYRRIRGAVYPDLTPIVPQSYTTSEVIEQLQGELTHGQINALDDTRNVYIGNIKADLMDLKTLDVKIGKSTTSFRENIYQQGKSEWESGLKSLKFLVGADLVTGSMGRGWRVVAGTDASESRVQNGMRSQGILSRFSDNPEVWEQIISKMREIRKAAKQSQLGFIAASVFLIHGKRDGESIVDAKLIDFTHVIDAERPFRQGIKNGPPSVRDQVKHHAQFISGLDSLIEDSRIVRERLDGQNKLRHGAAHMCPAVTSTYQPTPSPSPPAVAVPAKANTCGSGLGR